MDKEKKPAVEEKLEPPKNPSNPMGPRPAGPASDSASVDEYGTEGSTTGGGRTSVGTGPDHDPQRGRMEQNPVNFRRGMFGLMAAFDWNKGKFSEHPQDVALREEAMGLLGIPIHLSSQFSPERMEEFMKTLQTSGKRKEDTGISEEAGEIGRQGEYVRNLIKLSQTRHGGGKKK